MPINDDFKPFFWWFEDLCVKYFAFTGHIFVVFGVLLGFYLCLWDFRGLFFRGAGMWKLDKE